MTTRNDVTASWVARDARATVRAGPGAIHLRQAERLRTLVAYARSRSRFYGEQYQGLPAGIADLQQLPPTDKKQLMARFDDWVTDPEVTLPAVRSFVAGPGNLGADFLGRYAVFTTSGSTGVPTLLVQDRSTLAVMNGLMVVRYLRAVPAATWVRVFARGGRLAAVFASGGHFLSATMFERRLRARASRRRRARFLSVLDPLPQLVEQLNGFRPAILSSYASALGVLAAEQEAGRLRIRPALVFSGGEPLLPGTRQRVEAAFGAPLTDTYSASEALPLALPCRRGRQHVNADWYILEPVDEARRPVPPGRRSASALVTNLANFVQPLIRYELGDSITIGAQPCPCSSPLPTVEVEGRTDDVLKLPSPGAGWVELLPMALATVVEETPGVHRFQVLQTAPAALTVRLEPGPDAALSDVWGRVSGRLRGYLDQQGLPAVALDLSPDPPAANPASGKLRHIICAVLHRTGR